VKATVDGRVVGGATWLAPVNRTSTGGDPLPSEIAVQEMLALRKREEWEDELDMCRDLEFLGRFRQQTTTFRKNWSQGKEHWYLVSLSGLGRDWRRGQ
jgi:hypothetical protein